ncbi:XAC2610-related protein [Taibaiella koreensis]|uniref:XAC2610-related protein n=1 Tax=Taibaiella koreensis TaxID=1268548 RepID=UPI0013C2D99B|nr:hypothetical protein [Taibaiella koreensis]
MKHLLPLLILPSLQLHAQQAYDHLRKTGTLFSVMIDDSARLIVTRNADGKRILDESLSEYDAGVHLDDTSYGLPYRIWDINFDGYDDLSFSSSSGNVQRFEAVYLYDPSRKTLAYQQELSEIACLDVDRKRRLITGNCFHSSAAENWTETYRWQKGKLILVEKEGTMPCPADQDCYYTYKQKRIKGKMVYVYKDKNKL